MGSELGAREGRLADPAHAQRHAVSPAADARHHVKKTYSMRKGNVPFIIKKNKSSYLSCPPIFFGQIDNYIMVTSYGQKTPIIYGAL